MGTRRKCLCAKDLRSKCTKSNLNSKKRISNLVQVEEMVQKDSLNLQVSVHLWYAVLIRTIQASRFVLKVSKRTLSIHLTVGTHRTADRVKSKEISHKMASSECLEEVQIRIQELRHTHMKIGHQAWLTGCKLKNYRFLLTINYKLK